jgi:hypothetical protein
VGEIVSESLGDLSVHPGNIIGIRTRAPRTLTNRGDLSRGTGMGDEHYRMRRALFGISESPAAEVDLLLGPVNLRYECD